MKPNKKAIITVCGVGVVCIVALAACWLAGGKKNGAFEAEAPLSPPTSSWSHAENLSGDRNEPVSASAPEPDSGVDPRLKDYPRTVEETTSRVVIDFTPPASEPESAAEPLQSPGPTPDPVYSEPEREDYRGETGGGGGETGNYGSGEVIHDPAFGDVIPGQAQQQEVDNDGDPDKQVGTM